MAKLTKKLQAAYKAHGVQVSADASKIVSPNGMESLPLLKDGNDKTGPLVKTWSMLPTNDTFKTSYGEIAGTCPLHCDGCYGTCGFYNCPSCRDSLALNTILATTELEHVDAAIRAQLDTLPNTEIRIHATGDFFNDEYLNMWRGIVRDYKNNKFWTYTKTGHDNAFDEFDNANIVNSILPNGGFNFGHIAYIFRAYVELVARGETPYLCRCTFDKNQHCQDCGNCIKNKYVLFVEHSTDYVAANDPLFPSACKIVDMQKDHTHAEIAREIAKTLFMAENLPGLAAK